MLFSSFIFLFIFLPAVMIMYFILPSKWRNSLLLLASMLFYALGEPEHLKVMLAIILLNYIAGIAIEKYYIHSKKLVIMAVITNLAVLAGYKYIGFIFENINAFMITPVDIPAVALPIGISFYIFQSLSYTVDVYRKVVPVQRNLFKLALYISMFPQLVAGPIVRYRDFVEDIDNRQLNLDDVLIGIRRFVIGLGKKVVIANSMGELADEVFSAGSSDISMSIAWLGAIAYSLQIFFDFSGYSDMAIGLGRMFGFKYLENFNYPYIASSMTDFWRRWHISLSTWFRDYVYIPLGGSRCGVVRHSMNLLAVFFLTGLWHGASWSFVAWGLWHGVFLLLEKRFLNLDTTSIIGHVYTLIIVVTGWVIFRADSLAEALNYIGVMYGIDMPEHVSLGMQYYIHNKLIIAGMLGLLLCYPWKISMVADKADSTKAVLLKDVGILLILLVSLMYLTVGTYNPFIYFKF